jgi:hypothetical protein
VGRLSSGILVHTAHPIENMAKIPDGTVKTSLTINKVLWAKFQSSTSVLGMTDRGAVEDAIRAWMLENGQEIAAAHRRAADELEPSAVKRRH